MQIIGRFSNYINEQNFDLNYLKEEISIKENEVLPPPDCAFLFDSTMLHGSTLNTTEKTRISFDFRISRIGDIT